MTDPTATRALSVRRIPRAHAEWLANHPSGDSQEAVVRGLIADAYRRAMEIQPGAPDGKPSTSGDFRFIDLFAGIGGFYLGMTSAGGQCVYANEWDKYANKTYRAWYGGEHLDPTDITQVDYATIPDHDVLCAGFPCQPFSIAGVSKKNALGRPHGFQDEEQGNLFFAICDIAKAKRPKIMVLENVKNLASHDKGKTIRVILESLDLLGYEVRSKIIDAQAWVPQHRERIFLVCFDRDTFTESEIDRFEFPREPRKGPVLSSILEESPDLRYMLTEHLWQYLQNYAAKHQAAGNGFGYGLVDGSSVTRTMSARYYKDGSEILIKQPGWPRPRRLTPSEAALLMGFDQKFAKSQGHKEGAFPIVVSDTQAYKQFGNSVSPKVTQALAKQVAAVLRDRGERLGI